jgi:hypothetical protein
MIALRYGDVTVDAKIRFPVVVVVVGDALGSLLYCSFGSAFRMYPAGQETNNAINFMHKINVFELNIKHELLISYVCIISFRYS